MRRFRLLGKYRASGTLESPCGIPHLLGNEMDRNKQEQAEAGSRKSVLRQELHLLTDLYQVYSGSIAAVSASPTFTCLAFMEEVPGMRPFIFLRWESTFSLSSRWSQWPGRFINNLMASGEIITRAQSFNYAVSTQQICQYLRQHRIIALHLFCNLMYITGINGTFTELTYYLFCTWTDGENRQKGACTYPVLAELT